LRNIAAQCKCVERLVPRLESTFIAFHQRHFPNHEATSDAEALPSPSVYRGTSSHGLEKA